MFASNVYQAGPMDQYSAYGQYAQPAQYMQQHVVTPEYQPQTVVQEQPTQPQPQPQPQPTPQMQQLPVAEPVMARAQPVIYQEQTPMSVGVPAQIAPTSSAGKYETKEDMEKAVFNTLDNAKFSFFHVKQIVLAGAGFMADAYDLFCIGMLTKLIGRMYYTAAPVCTAPDSSHHYWTCKLSKPGGLPVSPATGITIVALVGALCGQLVWGHLGDMFGRKMIYGITLWLMFIASICSAMSYGTDANGVVGTLCCWRFLLGFGIGGGYPMSAVLMSESSSKSSRGAYVSAVFSMQGIGYLLAATLVIIVTAIFQAANPSTACPLDKNGNGACYPIVSVNATSPEMGIAQCWANHELYIKPSDDYVWRTILALGALPAMFTIYHQMHMPETARYTALVAQKAAQAAKEMSALMHQSTLEEIAAEAVLEETRPLMTWDQFYKHKNPNFVLQVIGTAGTWFFLDVAFYSQGLFQNSIYQNIGWVPAAVSLNALQETFLLARAQAIVTLSSVIPGYWASIATMDILGRRFIQIMGFILMTALMAFLSGFYTPLVADHLPSFIAMYCLTFFFANFGPNTTTYILPAELFPAHFRSTCHGFSAAMGKLGAIVGATGFNYAAQGNGINTNPLNPAAGYPPGIGLSAALGILAATNFLGLVMTIFMTPETMGKSLEELNGTFDDDSEHEAARQKQIAANNASAS